MTRSLYILLIGIIFGSILYTAGWSAVLLFFAGYLTSTIHHRLRLRDQHCREWQQYTQQIKLKG